MNPTPVASASPVAPARRIRWGRWILGVFAASILVVAIAAIDTVTLGSDARAVRRAAFGALAHRPGTKVEISAGWMLLGAARSVMAFVPHVPAEARTALRAVRSASVGVYQARHDIGGAERAKLLAATATAMERRGWARTVTVIEHGQTVSVFTRDGGWFSNNQKVCVVVCEAGQLVIVTATADPAPLIELAAKQAHLAAAD